MKFSSRHSCLAALLVLQGLLVSAGQETELMPIPSDSHRPAETLREFLGARTIGFDDIRKGIPAGVRLVVWTSYSRELPDDSRDPSVVSSIRRFLESGGGLFLVGNANQWVVDLGLETRPPDRLEVFRTGHSDQGSGIGIHHEGLAFPADHPLMAGLEGVSNQARTFAINSSPHPQIVRCRWEKQPPERAVAVAGFYRCDETGQTLVQPDRGVLNLWRLGDGRVLGYGNSLLLEPLWHNPDQANLERFVENVARFLVADEAAEIACLPTVPARLEVDELMSPPAFPSPQPHSLRQRIPGFPYITHWGWHGATQYQRANRESKDLAYFQEHMIDESFRWGANLLEFYPPGMRPEEGFPFDWSDDDPIPPPDGKSHYWGGPWDPKWNAANARVLFRKAHERDMLVQTFFHPNPLNFDRGTSWSEVVRRYLDFTEFQSRELQNPLRYGWKDSDDGLGSEWWGNDRFGETISAVWAYNPGSYRYSTNYLPATGPFLTGTWMCAFARAAGLNACGYGDQWRNVYFPPLYLSYQADCRSMKPSNREWGMWGNYGGGSTPDWVLRQANDFARDRLDADSAIWWLGEPSSTLKPENRPYVYGISADPIRCAVAATMRAVGSDGYRARARATVDGLPKNYTCEEPYPQDTAFIQNNYIRILRMAEEDRGILQHDPTRLAHFHDSGQPLPPLDLSPSVLSVRAMNDEKDKSLSGSQDGNDVILSWGRGDSSGNAQSFRGSGGFEKRAECSEAAQLPARLAYEQWPEWPQELDVLFDADPGRYEVAVSTAATSHTATIEVEADGRAAGVFFTRPRPMEENIVPVSLADKGRHRLRFRVQKTLDPSGLAVEFVSLTIRRRGDTAVLVSFPQSAGHQAVMEEEVPLTRDGQTRQTRRYVLNSDSPMIRVDVRNESPSTTGWQTRMKFPGHKASKTSGAAGDVSWIRLDPKEPGPPALVIFMQETEGESRLSFAEGVLMIDSQPQAGSSGFQLGLLIDDGLYPTGSEDAVWRCLSEMPVELHLGAEPVTVENPFGIPGVRVVRVTNPNAGPFMVAEAGSDGVMRWLVRGGQPTDDGATLLKVYLHDGGVARVQSYGYIRGEVKPGYGCQYALAIEDTIEPGRCVAEVLRTGPMLFAPRLDFARPFDSVKVNGEPWRYFDESVVYLPNRPGRYEVEIHSSGAARPHLARTFASIDAVIWHEDANELELRASPPHGWKGPLPGDIPYTAMVLSEGYALDGVSGEGELIPPESYRMRPEDAEIMHARGAILRLRPGVTRLRYTPPNTSHRDH